MEIFFLFLLVILMASALGSGFPVAFALPGSAIVTIVLAGIAGYVFDGDMSAYFHSSGPKEWLTAGVSNLRGIYWEVERDTLIAIPLFIFMGIMLQKSKIAEDLLVTMAQLFGQVPGGLGISVVLVGALLAATTGIVGATVVAMGLISLPAMLRKNYSPSLATGTIAASGTLGQIIPPSIVLIILADQLATATDQASSIRKAMHKDATGELMMPSILDVSSTSAGEMFLGAFVPGLVLVALYALYILVYAFLFPKNAPAVPYEGKMDGKFWGKVGLTLIPPLTLILLVLGSIITGIATVNQAGAIGAAGAIIMAGYRLVEDNRNAYTPAIIAMTGLVIIYFALSNFEMNLKAASDLTDWIGISIGILGSILILIALVWSGYRLLKIDGTMNEVMLETAKTTSLVFIILLGAAILTSAFRAFGGEELVREFLNSLPGGFWSKFLMVMAVIFVLGFFLDFIEIAVVVVPIVAPILLADPSANITAVWLGVMIGLNIQTSFLTPPFGFALFYLRGVAPAIVKTVQMYKGVIAFICLQLLALGIVGYFPSLVNYLPNRQSFLSENSPPPKNPKLQYCLEKYKSDIYFSDDQSVQRAVELASKANYSSLPKNEKSTIDKFFVNVPKGILKLQEAIELEEKIRVEAKSFRPLQTKVRRIEHLIREEEQLIKEFRDLAKKVKDKELAKINERIAEKGKIIEALKKEIPEDWKKIYKDFRALLKSEQKARTAYRRSVDSSYATIENILETFSQQKKAQNIKEKYAAFHRSFSIDASDENQKVLKELSKGISSLGSSQSISKQISSLRKELKREKPSEEKVKSALDGVLSELESWEAWVSASRPNLEEVLVKLKNDLKTTVGARAQPTFDRKTALYVAACDSVHRDLSLNF